MEDRSTNTAVQQRIQRQYAERNIKQPANRYEKPATSNRQPVASQLRSRNNQTRVKPMNSQSPVYHTNTKPMAQQQRRVQNTRQPQVIQRSAQIRPQVQRNVQVMPNRSVSNNQRSVQRSQPVVRNTSRPATKPARSNRSQNKPKSSSSKSSSNNSARGSSKARDSSRSTMIAANKDRL